jgi:YD repeat-containing protein
MQRGTLNAGKTAITGGTSTFAECWGLDTTGNWSNYRQDDDGDGSWDLIQNRANNTVNEITNITESAGPSWITPAYDAAGNMTTIPKPANPTAGYTGIYDAWNRLTAIKEGGDFVAEYAYDPAKRRTIQKTYSSGVLSETRHLYYTEPDKWQVIEERIGSSSDAERQLVWGLRYIDDIVLRDRDTNSDGSLDERLYATQDANWNVTAITNASGTVQERYAYSAYGVPIFLDVSFNARGSSSYQWETLFVGYRWDAYVMQCHVRNRVLGVNIGWLQRDPLYSRLSEFTMSYDANYFSDASVHINPMQSDVAYLYSYCQSNPVQYYDSLGLFICGLVPPRNGPVDNKYCPWWIFGPGLSCCRASEVTFCKSTCCRPPHGCLTSCQSYRDPSSGRRFTNCKCEKCSWKCCVYDCDCYMRAFTQDASEPCDRLIFKKDDVNFPEPVTVKCVFQYEYKGKCSRWEF